MKIDELGEYMLPHFPAADALAGMDTIERHGTNGYHRH